LSCRIEPQGFFDLGEHTLVYFKAYEHSDALSDLGVKEDELEPIDP
jgi:hypothetical protein